MSFIWVSESYFEWGVNFLYPQNWSIMREKSPYDLYFIWIFNIPQKHHFVTVNRYNPVTMIVSNYSKHIWKFTRLGVRNLYFLDSCFDIGLAKGWWLLKCGDVLEGFGIEHAYHSISTSTVEGIVDRVNGAAKGSRHFDIHPFR